MGEPHCIVTGELITLENNSRAHVIPSALGGRLKPWDILSKNGNGLLGDKIDLPLVQAFQALMTLLNGSRDRGDNQPVRMTDANGRRYVLKFGEPLSLATPNFQEIHTEADAEAIFHIDARNLKELRTLLGRVKAKHLEFDIDEAMKNAITVRNWPDGMLHSELQIGPNVVFPAIFVAASIYAVHCGYPQHPELKDYVDRFDPDEPEMPPDTFYFCPAIQWISAPSEVTHLIAFLASANQKEALVYFELFNTVPIAVLMPYAGLKDVRETYAVDVLTGADLKVTIDEKLIEDLPWRQTHEVGDAELRRFTKERIEKLIRISQDRAFEAEVESLITRAFGTDKERRLTSTDFVNLIAEIVEFVQLEWRRPLVTLESMEDTLHKFTPLCLGFEKILAAQSHQDFLESVEPHRLKLEATLSKKRAETAA